ncbi:MAG: NADH-quinone oxidoreductase subunit F, partial [Pseudomonadota bacterium]
MSPLHLSYRQNFQNIPPHILQKFLNHVVKKEGAQVPMSEIEEKFSAYRREKVTKPLFFVGTGTCGMAAGANKTLQLIREYLQKKNIDAEIVEVGCIGLCSAEPMVDIQLPGKTRVSFQNITDKKIELLLDSVLAGKVPLEPVVGQYKEIDGQETWKDVPFFHEHAFFKTQIRWVLANCGINDPVNIDEYIAKGGYSGFLKVIHSIPRADVCDMVEKSGIRGRGGGGFPTGKKWKVALTQSADQKYMICNADEGDPGAFMDRAVIEGDPHKMLEGLMIAAYAIGATKAYVYIRAEYPVAIVNLKKAIAQAKSYGLLGENIYDSGLELDVIIKMGAGAFVCGEETALIHSIEGKRGMPRPRPPYPAMSGLWGKPSVINNVETLANIPLIVSFGAAWFSSLGTATSKGTKVFALSGKIRRTGLVEIPMGTTIREIIFEIAGGIERDRAFKAVQFGGPSGGCVPTEHLDLKIDYE